MQTLDRGVHVFHQEGVMESVQTRTEEGARLFECLHSALYKQFGENLVNTDFGGQPVHLPGIRRFA